MWRCWSSLQILERTYAHVLDKFRNGEVELLNNLYDENNFSLSGNTKNISPSKWT